MRIIALTLLFFVAVLPSFGQSVDTTEATEYQQLWNSMSEEQKNSVVEEFLTQSINENIEQEKAEGELLYFYQNLNTLDEDEREEVCDFVDDDYDEEDEEHTLGHLAGLDNKEKPIAEMFLAMSKTEKETIQNLFDNEDSYYSGRNLLKAGLIMSGIGVIVGGYSTYETIRLSRERDNILAPFGMIFTGTFMVLGDGVFLAGTSLTIAGAVKKSRHQKYKPIFAVAPNSVRFVMEF